MAQIALTALHKRFGDFVAVRDTHLVIEDGEFFVLLGPSGCGKTTTLRMIAGLEIPNSGQILLGGRDVTGLRAARRDIAFVFQLFALYPHMNVRKNLTFPLRAQGASRAEIKTRLAEVARLLQIEPLLNRPVGGLSSGDRQRVALGRAIIRRPQAFLMDEPLGTLDAEFRERMCEELRQLHDRVRATTVYVTHDQTEALAMADRIAVMDGGEVLQADTPEVIYDRPANKFVASFIGSPAMNFLPADTGLNAGDDRLGVAGTALAVRPVTADCARVSLGVRPEHLRLAETAGPNTLAGEVFGVEYLGARQLATVDTAAGRVKVRLNNTARLHTGERVGLRFAPEHALLFDDASGRALTHG